MAWYWWLAVIWAFCGFLAFGFAKGFWKAYHKQMEMKWDSTFALCTHMPLLMSALFGPVGLVAVIAANFSVDRDIARKFCFCLRMPKELCAKEE